jgi:transcriptional regulator with XRE-family HTH domain
MDEQGLSIPDVARRTNLADSTIRSIVNRKSKTVALEVAAKISAGLDVPLERLNGYNTDALSEQTKEILLSSSGVSKETGHYVDRTTPEQLQDLGAFFFKFGEEEVTLGKLIDNLKMLPVDAYGEVEQALLYIQFKHKLREGRGMQ